LVDREFAKNKVRCKGQVRDMEERCNTPIMRVKSTKMNYFVKQKQSTYFPCKGIHCGIVNN